MYPLKSPWSLKVCLFVCLSSIPPFIHPSILPSIMDRLLKRRSTDLEVSNTLEFGKHWPNSHLLFCRWAVGPSVNWLDLVPKGSICAVILSIYTVIQMSVFSPGRCTVFWSTGCCSGHDSVFSVVILCSVQRPNAGRKSACCGRCLLFYLCLLWLTCAFHY